MPGAPPRVTSPLLYLPYCTAASVTAALGLQRVAELTGDPRGGQVDADRLERAVAAATSKIRTAVLMHYSTDLDGRERPPGGARRRRD